MQLIFRCKHCGQFTMDEDSGNVSLEIDALEGEIRFLCVKCKKQNTFKWAGPRKHEPLPQMILSR